MEEGMITSSPPGLEDIPELIHRIQSLMPVNEATHTSILNKSWQQAWSTIPTLRFHESLRSFSLQAQPNTQFSKMVDATLVRYFRDNIPINGFDLKINKFDPDHESASLVFKWLRLVATLSCLKDLSLTVHSCAKKFTLPDEILSGESLNTICLTSPFSSYCVSISSNTIIKCVSLKILKLHTIHLSDEVLDKVLSTCSLLEKIQLRYCRGFKTIKLKNLHHLHKLRIASAVEIKILEIAGVPHLHSFSYHRIRSTPMPHPINMDSLASVTELCVIGVILDQAFFAKIKSKFHRLKSLTIDTIWMRESLDVSCASLKTLVFGNFVNMPIYIRVYAPKLVFFRVYRSHSASFIVSTDGSWADESCTKVESQRPH